MKFNHELYFTDKSGEERVFEVEYTCSRYCPARTSGPPERCYPAEGGEIEVLRVREMVFGVPGYPDGRREPSISWDDVVKLRAEAECGLPPGRDVELHVQRLLEDELFEAAQGRDDEPDPPDSYDY